MLDLLSLNEKAIFKYPKQYTSEFKDSKCLVTINIGQSVHEGDKFKAILLEVNNSFKECTIMVCDSLQRHTLDIGSNSNMELLHAESNKLGDEWLERNMDTIRQLDIKYKIIRWDECLLSEDYKLASKQIELLYSKDIEFYNAVEKTALSFLDRYLNKIYEFKLRKDRLSRIREYLKEEAAVMLLWAKLNYQFEVYPLQRNVALRYVYQNFIAKTTPEFVREISVKFKTTAYDIINKYKKELQILQEKYAEKELALDNLLTNLPGHIYWTDKKNKFLGCNDQQAKDFCLKSRHEIIGRSVKFFQTPENAATILKNNNKVMRDGKVITEEEKFKEINGKESVYFSRKSPLKNKQGEILGVIGISLDITAHKERDKLATENQLYSAKVQNSRLESILAITPGHIYWKNLKGELQGCNNLQALDAGLKCKEDIIGLTDYDMPWKEDADLLRKIDAQVIETGEAIIAEEKSKTHDGRNATWLSTKEPLRDENGEIIGVIGISLDITAQKEAEQLKHENKKLEALNKLNQIILEKEIAEAERLRLENQLHKLENEKQKAILEEQEKFKKFVGQIVHDIKSPLASLIGVVNETGSVIPEGKRITLRQASMRIGDIAQHMLSRYKSKTSTAEIAEPVLVFAALNEVVGEKRYEHKSIKINTVINESSNFSFIRIEPSQFKRLLSNLINNAVEALEYRSNGEVTVEVSVDVETVFVVIADNGKGMPEELVNKIEKNIEVTMGKQNGSGIGLAQVRETLHRNYGELVIYSTEGEGTRVMLKFPRIEAPMWVAEEIKIVSGDTIVILDDDQSIHGAWDEKLIPILSKLPDKVNIKHFSVGQDAIDFLNSLSVSQKRKICLLTDYELLNQEINGLQVIEQTKIKRSILVTSHYANHEVRRYAANLRVQILPKELAFAIKIILDKKLKPRSKKVDMVCVDDDLGFVRGYIERFFSNLTIDLYRDPYRFLEDVAQYPLDTKIVLDNSYSNEYGLDAKYLCDGIGIARKLHKKGFTNLVMLTGEEPDPGVVPSYLAVILKDDDEKIKNLTKL